MPEGESMKLALAGITSDFLSALLGTSEPKYAEIKLSTNTTPSQPQPINLVSDNFKKIVVQVGWGVVMNFSDVFYRQHSLEHMNTIFTMSTMWSRYRYPVLIGTTVKIYNTIIHHLFVRDQCECVKSKV